MLGVTSIFRGERINREEAYSLAGACTNQPDEDFSRLRRGKIGIRHHIAGAYLPPATLRSGDRCCPNWDQMSRIANLALKGGRRSIAPDIGGAFGWNETIEARVRGKISSGRGEFCPPVDEPRMNLLRQNAYQINVLCEMQDYFLLPERLTNG
jgi:hypothetical protein